MRIMFECEPLRSMSKKVEASCYNQVCLALIRLHKPLRLALPRHTGLEIILDDDVWSCVDVNQGDMPILMWHSFETHARANLHEPIDCRLNLYHIQAGLVMGTVLDALQVVLRDRLSALGPQ